ncbi:hypothetical protein Scep_010178 [Stephania cephalantha]|uniref:Uncharacterized protein n=1 Tax=Stephania cephalantha TaxID=152367 RepID=A0AAP0PDV1_9MAGN
MLFVALSPLPSALRRPSAPYISSVLLLFGFVAPLYSSLASTAPVSFLLALHLRLPFIASDCPTLTQQTHSMRAFLRGVPLCLRLPLFASTLSISFSLSLSLNPLNKDNFIRLRDEALSQRDPESQEPPINEDRILYEALGKHDRKGRVYGFGSQASLSYYGTSGSDSSRRPSYRAEDGQALWEEYEELHEQLVRQMQDEMQEEREHQ